MLNVKSVIIPEPPAGGRQPTPLTLNRIAVTAVDRTGNESLLKEIEVK
jgi:hypothetical protein